MRERAAGRRQARCARHYATPRRAVWAHARIPTTTPQFHKRGLFRFKLIFCRRADYAITIFYDLRAYALDAIKRFFNGATTSETAFG